MTIENVELVPAGVSALVPVKAGDGDCYWLSRSSPTLADHDHLYAIDMRDDALKATERRSTLCGRPTSHKRIGTLAEVTCDECKVQFSAVLLIHSVVP